MKRYTNLTFLLIGAFYISVGTVMAQCPEGCEGTFPNCAPCFDPSTPIDGETGLLLIIGLAVGAFRLVRKKIVS